MKKKYEQKASRSHGMGTKFAGRSSHYSHIFSLLIGRSIKRGLLSHNNRSLYKRQFKCVFHSCRSKTWPLPWRYSKHTDLCPCMFNTTTALLRHRKSKHHIVTESATSFLFYNGQELVQRPKQKGQRSSSYKQWISGMADSINSCLHPKATGK